MAKKASKTQKERLFEEKLVPAKAGSGELFDVSFGDDDSPVECLGITFENDTARREHFLNLLRENLQDPEFRKIAGFPIGSDEDILAMSDPPYYTACPNPFIDDFLSHNGTEHTPDVKYHREPFTADVSEAIVDRVKGKTLLDYQRMMSDCFRNYCRVLKPGRWMTVEFHNSRNSVWNSIQEALQHAGFVVADVRTLDKKQGSFQQVVSGNTVKRDLIISAYKPNGGLEERFKEKAGTEEGVWDFITTHLRQLPVFVARAGQAEPVAERQDVLLFDRMVAFHVQRTVAVPMSSAEFRAALHERLPERDGMYFLPEQVEEYDRKRMTVEEVAQLQLFVSDEASAIQWLKQQLKLKPHTFQEMQPQFMQEVAGWEKHERTLELSELLEQNFLCYDEKDDVPSQIHGYLSSNFKDVRKLAKGDPKLKAKARSRWYVPDPRKEVDLEKIRHRALMREFNEYRQSKGKLKTVRSEALRAGFKECWQNTDYPAIVEMAERVREEIIQEDPALLMYYDNAVMLSGE